MVLLPLEKPAGRLPQDHDRRGWNTSDFDLQCAHRAGDPFTAAGPIDGLRIARTAGPRDPGEDARSRREFPRKREERAPAGRGEAAQSVKRNFTMAAMASNASAARIFFPSA